MAEQLEFFEIRSPCLGICQTDTRGFCCGCFRSREERFRWMKMNNAEKRDILRLCRQRLLRLQRGKKQSDESFQDQPSLF